MVLLEYGINVIPSVEFMLVQLWNLYYSVSGIYVIPPVKFPLIFHLLNFLVLNGTCYVLNVTKFYFVVFITVKTSATKGHPISSGRVNFRDTKIWGGGPTLKST